MEVDGGVIFLAALCAVGFILLLRVTRMRTRKREVSELAGLRKLTDEIYRYAADRDMLSPECAYLASRISEFRNRKEVS
jgi:hypothetical protein